MISTGVYDLSSFLHRDEKLHFIWEKKTIELSLR